MFVIQKHVKKSIWKKTFKKFNFNYIKPVFTDIKEMTKKTTQSVDMKWLTDMAQISKLNLNIKNIVKKIFKKYKKKKQHLRPRKFDTFLGFNKILIF